MTLERQFGVDDTACVSASVLSGRWDGTGPFRAEDAYRHGRALIRHPDTIARHELAEFMRVKRGTLSLHRNRLGAMGAGGLTPPAGHAMLKLPAGHTALPLPYSKAAGSKGGLVYEVFRNASALAVTPTQQNERLVGAWMEGGGLAGAGSWQFLYDGIHSSHYVIGASGLDATGAIGPVAAGFYAFNLGPIGQNIPAAAQTYFGGLAAVRFLLANKPGMGLPLSYYTAVAVTGNEAGTGGTSKTYSIPGPLGIPTAILGLASLQAGAATGIPSAEIDWPAIGNYAAYTVPALLSRGLEPFSPGAGYPFQPVPDYDPASSFALTHKAVTLAAATGLQIAGWLRYKWSTQATT